MDEELLANKAKVDYLNVKNNANNSKLLKESISTEVSNSSKASRSSIGREPSR